MIIRPFNDHDPVPEGTGNNTQNSHVEHEVTSESVGTQVAQKLSLLLQ